MSPYFTPLRSRSTNTLSSARPRPSRLTATPAPSKRPVSSRDVNCDPKSVLKISGRPRDNASSSASKPEFRTRFSHNLPCDKDLTAILTPNCSQNISGSFLTRPGCHRDIVPHGTQTPSCPCRQSHQHHQRGDLYRLLPPTHLPTGREGPA